MMTVSHTTHQEVRVIMSQGSDAKDRDAEGHGLKKFHVDEDAAAADTDENKNAEGHGLKKFHVDEDAAEADS
jgi:hypothetical protein